MATQDPRVPPESSKKGPRESQIPQKTREIIEWVKKAWMPKVPQKPRDSIAWMPKVPQKTRDSIARAARSSREEPGVAQKVKIMTHIVYLKPRVFTRSAAPGVATPQRNVDLWMRNVTTPQRNCLFPGNLGPIWEPKLE